MSQKRRSRKKNFVSFTIALAIVLGTFSGFLKADNWPLDVGEAQPKVYGYRAVTMLNWSPQTDPDAAYLRSKVPLQARISHDSSSQVNPNLNGKSEILLMQADYGNSFFNNSTLNDTFAENTLNFWQYTDYFSPWHGAATVGTPQGLYNPRTSDWRARGFEFGLLNIPNPAYTDAAHRNGVKSIAILYVDPAFRPGQTIMEFFAQDDAGHYIIADTMIEMANYYGFDGWFVNAEEGGPTEEQWNGFMQQLRDGGMYVNHYDTNSSFGDRKAKWLKGADSVFVNYGWGRDTVKSAVDYAGEKGYDPYKQVFFGVEANQGGFNHGHSSTHVQNVYEDAGKNPMVSLALFTPSDMYQRGLDIQNFEIETLPAYQLPEFQWMIADRERVYFSGGSEDPANTGSKDFAREDISINNTISWEGVADFTPARSVIDGEAFYSNFSTGKGMQYFSNGSVSRDEKWTNMVLQSLLPSWQWWIDAEGNRLNVDFDYGSKEVRKDINNQIFPLPYAQQGAYDGGNSLVLYGDLDGKNTLHLYKTDLQVTADSKLNLTYKKVSEDSALANVVLQFKNETDPVVLPIEGSDSSGDWTRASLDLAEYQGKTINKISIQVTGKSENYQLNLGELSLGTGAQTPEAPANLKVEKHYTTGELFLSWDLGDFSSVDNYHIYGEDASGREVFLGGGFNDRVYVKGLENLEGAITLKVCAVGKDGSESDFTQVSLPQDKAVTNLAVAEAPRGSQGDITGLYMEPLEKGKLEISWDAPASGNPDKYEISMTPLNLSPGHFDEGVIKVEIDGSKTSYTLETDTKEGFQYDLKVSSIVGGQVVASTLYRGRSYDSYVEPMTLEDVHISGGKLLLRSPLSEDWQIVQLFWNDQAEPFRQFTRGVSKDYPNKSYNGVSLPENNGILTIKLKDYSSDKDNPEETSVPFVVGVVDGELAEVHELSAKEVPDPVLLKWLRENVGIYVEQLATRVDPIDVSDLAFQNPQGLELLKNLKELTLSKNLVRTLTPDHMPPELRTLHIDKMEQLEVLDLTDLKLEKIENADCLEGWTKLKTAKLAGNYLDLSEGTKEQIFLAKVLEKVYQNRELTDDGKAPSTDILTFDRQKPLAYPHITVFSRTINLPLLKAGTYDFREWLAGDQTVRGNVFMEQEDLSFREVKILDESYDLLSARTDYSKYQMKYISADLVKGDQPVDAAVDNTYTVTYFDPNGTRLGDFVVNVGGGKPNPVNLAFQASVLGTSHDDSENGPDVVFDGEQTEESPGWIAQHKEEDTWLAFKTREEGRLVQMEYTNNKSSSWWYNFDNLTLEQLKPELLETITDEDLTNQEFLANRENWIEVAKVERNSDFEPSARIENKQGQIFRIRIAGPQWMWGDPAVIREFRLYGTPLKADKSQLQKNYDELMTYEAADFTEDSFEILKEALTEAKTVIEDDAAKQDTVDQVLEKLLQAKNQLKAAEKKVTVRFQENKEESNHDIVLVLNRGDVISKDKQPQEPLAYGKEFLGWFTEDGHAYEKTMPILEDMVFYARFRTKTVQTIDRSKLEDLVNKVQNTDEDLYTGSSWASVKAALQEAKELLSNGDARQDELDQAYTNLQKAYNALIAKANYTGTEPGEPDNLISGKDVLSTDAKDSETGDWYSDKPGEYPEPPANEATSKLTDGDLASKWCPGSTTEAWVVYDLGDTYQLSELIMYNANIRQGEGQERYPQINTKAARVEILKEGSTLGATELSDVEIAKNPDIWTKVNAFSNNTENIVNLPLNSAKARFVRIFVEDDGDHVWPGVRIQELKLMGNQINEDDPLADAKARLRTLIENNENFPAESYTEESRDALKEALVQAKNTLEDSNLDQTKLDQAFKQLEEAILDLKKIYRVVFDFQIEDMENQTVIYHEREALKARAPQNPKA